MSKEMDQITAMLNGHDAVRLAEENRLRMISEQERLGFEKTKEMFQEKSRKVMTSLGVTRIFADLRDSGTLVWNSSSCYEDKKTFFGYRRNLVSPFTPAKIKFGDDNVSISILFDHTLRKENDEDTKRISVLQDSKGNFFVESPSGKKFSQIIKDKDDIPYLIGGAIITATRN